MRTFLPGKFNLDNVAAAAACALAVDLPLESITSGVLSLQTVPGRMERIDRGQPFIVFVDYAHTEQALQALLEWLVEVTAGRVHLVFGCGGDRDSGKRFGMGRVAAQAGCRIYLTSDNPRGEEPQDIIRDIREGIASVPGGTERSTIISDRQQAIHSAIEEAKPGDAVLVAGKGHESTQTTGGRVEPFDDRLIAGQVLESLGWNGERNAGA